MKSSKSRKSRIYSILMNCTAPILTTILVSGAACWSAELKYGKSFEYDKNPESTAVLSNVSIPNNINEHTEASLPVTDITVSNNANSGAELVEACGIYIGDEFVGAVADGETVEKKLSGILEEYREEDDIIEADFAIEPDLKQGLYRTEALVDETDMENFLTGEKKIVSEYTAEKEDTPEKIAEDFNMSVDEVKELNPEIKEIEDGEQIKIKETVSVLPVKYTKEEQEEEIITLNSYNYDDNYEFVSNGIVGKKLKTYEVTYVDGCEVSRKLTATETVELPTETEYSETEIEGDESVNNIDENQNLYSESIPEISDLFSSNFIWPVSGGYISDPFLSDRNHKGLDIAAPSGTDIYASDAGVVVEAGWNDGGYGNWVVIDHGNGYTTCYAHASEVFVTAGQTVEQGELIAAVGTTGDSTGNHCHFEIRYCGSFLNPEDFI